MKYGASIELWCVVTGKQLAKTHQGKPYIPILYNLKYCPNKQDEVEFNSSIAIETNETECTRDPIFHNVTIAATFQESWTQCNSHNITKQRNQNHWSPRTEPTNQPYLGYIPVQLLHSVAQLRILLHQAFLPFTKAQNQHNIWYFLPHKKPILLHPISPRFSVTFFT